MIVKEYKEPKIKIFEERKESLQFLPKSLIPLSKIKKIKYKEKNLKTTYILDIVHTLLLKYYFKKVNKYSLSSIALKDKYGFQYNYYISYLVDNDIIQMVRNYQKGKSARVYRLNENIIKGDIIRFKNTDKILMRKYNQKRKSVMIDKSSNIIPEVKSKLINDLSNVKIHFEKTIFYLDSIEQDPDVYQKNKYSVECIKDNQIFYHFDKYGRMHTNFTILKSFIRKNCLSIDGFETIEFDIKNSQPLFLNKILDENVEKIPKDELNLYRYLTHNGLLYQHIINNSDIKEKKEVKKLIYKVFFGKNYKNKCDDIFKKIFPNIHQFIKDYKKEYGDYRVLSHKLQNLESNLIFNKIVRKIIKHNPKISIITVHDSIVCSKIHKNIVESIFNKCIEMEFSF